MKICPNCAYRNREGYMFCEDCGEDLTLVESIEPAPMQAATVAEATVVLRIHQTNKHLVLEPGKQTTLGRYDQHRERQPDLDLGPYNALELGVSNIHVMIEHSEAGVKIMDMGSTNGTYVNGRRLMPDNFYILQSGDEIRMGKLTAFIHF